MNTRANSLGRIAADGGIDDVKPGHPSGNTGATDSFITVDRTAENRGGGLGGTGKKYTATVLTVVSMGKFWMSSCSCWIKYLADQGITANCIAFVLTSAPVTASTGVTADFGPADRRCRYD